MSTQVQQPPAPPKKRKRGRETATDMVRSLGLVILVVVPVWFLAQAPSSDEAELREVDPSGALAAFAADAPQAPVPVSLPEGWRATSATYSGGDRSVRVGWVTPDAAYAEFSAAASPAPDFLEATAGENLQRLDPVVVDGVPWEQYREADGSLSLTRTFGSATVVVGTLRATAERAELEVLLRSLTAG